MTMAYPRWLINQHGPRQLHHQYLILTNLPDMVNRMEIIPGISDHEISFLDISTRVRLNKKTPRKIHLYHKGNIEGLIASLSDCSEGFCE